MKKEKDIDYVLYELYKSYAEYYDYEKIVIAHASRIRDAIRRKLDRKNILS